MTVILLVIVLVIESLPAKLGIEHDYEQEHEHEKAETA